MSMFPAMLSELNLPYPLSILQAANISTTLLIIVVSSCAVMFWDWAIHLEDEISLIWRKRRAKTSQTSVSKAWWRPEQRWIKWSFLFSRYIALIQALLVLFTFTLGRTYPGACNVTRSLPFGFSVANLAVHFVMVLRMYGLYNQSGAVLLSLTALAILDFVTEIVASTYVQPIYFALPAPGIHLCYLHPSSSIFALAFIAPTIFHHIILGFTLFKSYQHLKSERVIGGDSVVAVLRKDQILYVLAICLVNFVNVVLVLQSSSRGYKLICYLPSLALTQILLGRIVFSLRRYSNTAFLSKSISDPLHSKPPPSSPLQSSAFLAPINVALSPNTASPDMKSTSQLPVTMDRSSSTGSGKGKRMWGSMSTLFADGEHIPRGGAKGGRTNYISTYQAPPSPHEIGNEPSSPTSPFSSTPTSPTLKNSTTFLNTYRPVVLSNPGDLINRTSVEIIELTPPQNRTRPPRPPGSDV